MKQNRGYETHGSTIVADSTAMDGRRSQAIETELNHTDRAIIQDCVNRGILIHDCFTMCNQQRLDARRPRITQPAVAEFYNKCEKTAAKENCVFTNMQTTQYVSIQLFDAANNPLGTIKIPVCQPMAQDIAQHGVKAVTTVGLTGDLPPADRVTEGQHLPVLSGSRWHGKIS